jgi:hypothetical protein
MFSPDKLNFHFKINKIITQPSPTPHMLISLDVTWGLLLKGGALLTIGYTIFGN